MITDLEHQIAGMAMGRVTLYTPVPLGEMSKYGLTKSSPPENLSLIILETPRKTARVTRPGDGVSLISLSVSPI